MWQGGEWGGGSGGERQVAWGGRALNLAPMRAENQARVEVEGGQGCRFRSTCLRRPRGGAAESHPDQCQSLQRLTRRTVEMAALAHQTRPHHYSLVTA